VELVDHCASTHTAFLYRASLLQIALHGYKTYASSQGGNHVDAEDAVVAVAVIGFLAMLTDLSTSGASAATTSVKVKEATKLSFKPKPGPAPKIPKAKK
jgi:hypothetical protein